MSTKARNRVSGMILPLVGVLAGCGNYAITFEVADVINAPTTDVSREALDVDILCLSRSDVEKHPEIVNGTMRADEWFKAREEGDHRIEDISPARIYALRRDGAENRRDTLCGEALRSAIDREDGRRTTTVKVHHPEYLGSESAIVIYGRFGSERGGVARTPPLVIQPPGADEQIFVEVGRNGMRLAGRR
jgi:hypothetical protein